VGVGAAVGVAVGAADGVAVGAEDGDGDAEGCVDGLAEAVGLGCVLGLALTLGEGDGVTVETGPILRPGTMVPMRGRSLCGPPNGALPLGAAITRAPTTAKAASPVNTSGTATGRLRSGRSPVFCGDRAYARRSGVRMIPSAARLAQGALE
jgi:hypothetical protein